MSTSSRFKLKPSVLALMLMTVPMFAFGQQVTDVGIVSATGGKGDAENPKNYEAVLTSPVRSSVEFARPIAEISQNYIENFVAPTSTFASMANSILPGAYGYSNNGSGGGDEKIWFRGFKDGFFTMTFDGIPFNDTNDPTHHSQVFFPAPYIGGLTSDRSPGTAHRSALRTLAVRSEFCQSLLMIPIVRAFLARTVVSIRTRMAQN